MLSDKQGGYGYHLKQSLMWLKWYWTPVSWLQAVHSTPKPLLRFSLRHTGVVSKGCTWMRVQRDPRSNSRSRCSVRLAHPSKCGPHVQVSRICCIGRQSEHMWIVYSRWDSQSLALSGRWTVVEKENTKGCFNQAIRHGNINRDNRLQYVHLI